MEDSGVWFMAYHFWLCIRNQWNNALYLCIIYCNYLDSNARSQRLHHALYLNMHHSNRSFCLYRPSIVEHH